jgi:polyhydroxyalkanoate synthesis regulator phasin
MEFKEFVRKTAAFGLGTASFSAEKFKAFVNEMVDRGEMSSDEAKTFVEDMGKRAAAERESMKQWIDEHISKVFREAKAAKTSRMDALEKRVAVLEEKLGLAPPACEVQAEEEDLIGDEAE